MDRFTAPADTTPPVTHDCPDDIEVDAAPGARDAQVWWIEPTATDAESGIASFTSTHLPGERFPLGIVLVSYVATDVVGNATTCSFLIIVHETVELVAPLETGEYLDHVWDAEEGPSAVGELPVVEVYVVGEPIEGSCMVVNWRDRPFCYDTISFLVGGGEHRFGDPEGVCAVALVVDDAVVHWATGRNSETMRRVSWDVSPYRGEVARIRIIDEHTGHWGHINCDDFQMTDRGVRVPFAGG